MSPAKQQCATTKKVWLPDRHTDRQTDAGQSDPYVPLCFAHDTKTNENKILKRCINVLAINCYKMYQTKLHHIIITDINWLSCDNKIRLGHAHNTNGFSINVPMEPRDQYGPLAINVYMNYTRATSEFDDMANMSQSAFNI